MSKGEWKQKTKNTEVKSPVKGWGHLRFWSYYYKYNLDKVEGEEGKMNRLRSLQLCPYDRVKCVIIGGYPNPTGLAFSEFASVKKDEANIDAKRLVDEYVRDLDYRRPRSFDFSPWVRSGCLLLPTPFATVGKGWNFLHLELLSTLARSHKKPCVLVFIGDRGKKYLPMVEGTHQPVIVIDKIEGSCLFTWINFHLEELGLEPFSWRLE